MVKYSKHGLRMAELWLDAPVVKPADCDLLLLQQYSRLPAGAVGWPFSTLTINLTACEEQLLEGLHRDTRYKVRRADSKDQIVCLHEPHADDALCRAFHAYYEEFAAAKGVDRLSLAELLARAQDGALRFSRAMRGEATLVWHVHAVMPHGATLLHSASQFRSLDDNDARAVIGRANRLLHWRDMLAFKAEGKSVYDFGGWYAGQDDADLLRINQFKEGFGGLRTDQVNAGIALTWRGWLYLTMRRYFSAEQRHAMKAKILSLAGARGSH